MLFKKKGERSGKPVYEKKLVQEVTIDPLKAKVFIQEHAYLLNEFGYGLNLPSFISYLEALNDMLPNDTTTLKYYIEDLHSITAGLRALTQCVDITYKDEYHEVTK